MKKALFCKSFRGDFDVLPQLLSSARDFAPDMGLLLSVPKDDAALLRDSMEIPSQVSVICDEDYLAAEERSKSGWFQQQICKLAMHRLDFADAYMMLDSDTYLIAPVRDDHFVDGDRLVVVASEIFTKIRPGNAKLLDYIAAEPTTQPGIQTRLGSLATFDARLKAAREEHAANQGRNGREREIYIRQIFDSRQVATQPAQIFHAPLLRQMEAAFDANGMRWNDVINLAPWEYNWYGYFAMATPDFPVIGRTSPVVHFASEADVDFARAQGITTERLARRFCAIQMAARHFETIRF